MQLLSVEIDGLFGRFNHRIKIDKNDRLSIVIAPNGYGKTVSLRLIRALLSLEFSYLRLVEFRRMRLNFERNIVLSAERLRKTDKKRDRVVIEVRLTENGTVKGEYESGYRDTSDRPDLANVLDSIVPHLSRISYDRFVDDFTGRQLSTQEAYVAYEHLIPRGMLPPEKETPAWLSEFPAKIKIRFIEAQRLVSLAALERETRAIGSSSRKDRAMVVRAQSDALAERIKRTIQRFAAHSQTLEQSFPRRLVERSKDTANVSAQTVLQALGAQPSTGRAQCSGPYRLKSPLS